MTEAGWTRKKPTVAGWYWWRDVDKRGKVRFCVCQEVYMLHGSLFAADCGYLDKLSGEWLGPITPTDRQQGRVAAFKEAEQRFDSMFGATDRRIDSVRDYRVGKFYTWLVQAAQDEKGAGE